MSTQLKLKKPAKKKTTPKLSVVNAPTLRTAALGLAALAAVLLCAPLFLSTFQLTLMSRLVCYAIVAVGIGLAWGRGGMLTLGQGVFFGIGAYIMAMHMLYSDSQILGPQFRNGGPFLPTRQSHSSQLWRFPASWLLCSASPFSNDASKAPTLPS